MADALSETMSNARAAFEALSLGGDLCPSERDALAESAKAALDLYNEQHGTEFGQPDPARRARVVRD